MKAPPVNYAGSVTATLWGVLFGGTLRMLATWGLLFAAGCILAALYFYPWTWLIVIAFVAWRWHRGREFRAGLRKSNQYWAERNAHR